MSNFDLHESGMEFVSEQLAGQNWIVETIRNGQDDYLQINKPDSYKAYKAYKAYKIKVKALSGETPVPFHTRSPDSMSADIFVIYRNLSADNPEIFTATVKEVTNVIHMDGSDYWLETKDYENFERGLTKLESLKTFQSV